ncbi:hypothetical protein HPB48_019240 [Haemaphysalis longicornis]|uniref:Uncharacterized protein n=1 Tax=Haemaphysalis longicornis TaxID=44386 RepID=A0A9J6GPQ9_HAELO|nr:hypothetical protein HPB48_019240 [Haemaphysalis longicornis]
MSGKIMAHVAHARRGRPASATKALDRWIADREASARLVGSPAYFESVRLPQSHDNDVLSYDSFLNSVTVSLLAAFPPFYYPNGSLAANYGGLGAAFAVTLMRGLSADPEGLRKVGNGTCGQATAQDRWHFMPALQAFRERQKSESLEEVAGFGGEALFFISYCHTQRRLDASFNCTKQLGGMLSFKEAFRCAPGARMAISEDFGTYVAL